jgi:hypothetical protein
MSKTRRRYQDRDYFDGPDDGEYRTFIDKKSARRFERALKVKNVEDLIEEPGLDPDDYANWLDEELMDLQNADIHVSK